MSNASGPTEYRPELLSAREREVVDLAVLGRTDELIAQTLGITPATVSSYWVRIRGKIGALSRTEIVGLVLRHESAGREATLTSENERLQISADRAHADLAQSRSDLHAIRGTDWHLLALDHVPHALVVCRPPGRIVYANLQAQHTFAAEPGEMNDVPLWELTIPQDRPARQAATAGFFAETGAARVVVGVERPYYALRRDGTNFRCILVAERFRGPDGTMSVVTFRETYHEVESLLKMLRKPFEVH